MSQSKSKYEIRFRTLQGAIVSSIVMVVLYVSLSAVGHLYAPVVCTPSPLGGYLAQWGESYPIVSYVILSIGVLYISINLAQLASRFRLYGTPTHMPMEIYPILMLVVGLRGDILVGVVATLLLLNALKNLFSSYRATNSSGALSLGVISLGAIPLLCPSAIVLWVVVPPMLIIFERTLREVIVTLFSLAIPLFGYLYIMWMRGGDFMEELYLFWESVVTYDGLYMWSSASVVGIVACALAGVVLLLSTFVIHRLDNTVKARRRLVVCALFAFASVVMAFMPSSSWVSMWLLALPLALLAPVMMLSLGRVISFWIYILLLIMGLLSAFLGDGGSFIRYFLNFV